MNARQAAVGKALQELEPAVLDLARMAHLVSEYAEGCFGRIDPGIVQMPSDSADALLFGIYDIDRRIRDLREAYELALNQTAAA
jgi:hypothetical protein